MPDELAPENVTHTAPKASPPEALSDAARAAAADALARAMAVPPTPVTFPVVWRRDNGTAAPASYHVLDTVTAVDLPAARRILADAYARHPQRLNIAPVRPGDLDRLAAIEAADAARLKV